MRRLQLATYLYKECLLDVDHFLDWILHQLGQCTSERLFIWLLIVSIPHYWKDITSYRMRGKRLAEALLNHVTKASLCITFLIMLILTLDSYPNMKFTRRLLGYRNFLKTPSSSCSPYVLHACCSRTPGANTAPPCTIWPRGLTISKSCME